MPCTPEEIRCGNDDSREGAPVEEEGTEGQKETSGEERSNEEWLAALRDCNLEVIEALCDRLVRGLLAALRQAPSQRASFQLHGPRQRETLAEEAATEALRTILADLAAFPDQTSVGGRWEGPEDKAPKGADGERRFTTWAQKIAVRIAFMKLRGNS